MSSPILIVDRIFFIFLIMLFIRLLGSWFPEYSQNRFMQFIFFYTEPYLQIFRKFIPPLGVIDISPIFAFLCLGVIEAVVKSIVAWLFL